MSPLFYLTLAISLFCLVALATVLLAGMEKRIAARRLFSMTKKRDVPVPGQMPRAFVKQLGILRWMHSMLALLPAKFVPDASLHRRLACGGFRGPGAADIFVAARIFLPLAALLLGCIPPHHGILPIVFMALGYLGPDLILRRQIKKRAGRIRHSLPDAIDLLVICVEAGLGMDQALTRINQELALRHPDITQEFTQLNLEQRAGKPRIQAWQTMAERLDMVEITSFLNMLIQTERFGTPIGKALSTFAENMREKRRQQAEEKAAKTAVKITLPLALFIFPSIFVVLLGPAILSIMHKFPTFGH